MEFLPSSYNYKYYATQKTIIKCTISIKTTNSIPKNTIDNDALSLSLLQYKAQ